MAGEKRVIVARDVRPERIPTIIEALGDLHLAFTLTKEYVDYRDYIWRDAPPEIVGVAKYTILVYSPVGDERKRYETYRGWLMPIFKAAEIDDKGEHDERGEENYRGTSD